MATLTPFTFTNHVVKPFDEMQKQTAYALVKFNLATLGWEVILLDLDDAEYFLNDLAAHRDAEVGKEGSEIVLYDLERGIIQQGPGELKNSEINDSNSASMLLAQAKFFNGITIYTPQQEIQLHQWIKTHGAERMRRLFMDIITRHRSNRPHLMEMMDHFFR